jgi:hypothetical protein
MGYLGMAELMVASGAVRAVQARCVYENEEFQYEQGLDPILRHVPIGVPKERGALKGAYCILRIRGGDVFDFMSIEDIDAIRNRYSKQWSEEKVGACPPWYAEKTDRPPHVEARAEDAAPRARARGDRRGPRDRGRRGAPARAEPSASPTCRARTRSRSRRRVRIRTTPAPR